ncbi:ArsR family transcriptional regulator [Halobellus sp. GM3]|uniref:ArsR family transcriptional regulator n=1 Tax=Halobellus sp. GM3 TaxID=3458410 RepID=UPI00403DE32B
MPIRLTQPTDFLILDVLSDGRRDLGANISNRINKDRGYVNTRLPVLADYGLVQKIGPIENSGLYQITPLGIAAVDQQSLYSKDREQFQTAISDLEKHVEIQAPKINIE